VGEQKPNFDSQQLFKFGVVFNGSMVLNYVDFVFYIWHRFAKLIILFTLIGKGKALTILVIFYQFTFYRQCKKWSVRKISTIQNVGYSHTNLSLSFNFRVGLDLINGVIRDNKKAGVLEPAMSKIKCLKFATEAAITILRIDDLVKLEPDKKDDNSYQAARAAGRI